MIISPTKVEKVLHNAFPNCKFLNLQRSVKGLINISYEIKISNPKKELILRLFPLDSWKAKKEAYLYSLIKKRTDIPLPEIYDVENKKGILPYAYILMEKVGGKPLSAFKNPPLKLLEQAGLYLAQIHSIKFPYFGWLVDNTINPVFNTWKDFFLFDTNFKLKKAMATKKLPKTYAKKLVARLKEDSHLLEIKDKPSLLHKDFHQAHIFTDGKKITGIIDLEWAIAGHNEMDMAKTKWRMFDLYPKWEEPFMKGYLKQGKISKDFDKRERLYRLNLLLGSIGLASETRNNAWLKNSLRWLKELLK